MELRSEDLDCLVGEVCGALMDVQVVHGAYQGGVSVRKELEGAAVRLEQGAAALRVFVSNCLT